METFTWVPFNTPSVSDAFYVLSTEFESGKKQKRFKGSLPTTWTLTMKVTFAEMMAIRAFYHARRGSYESFYWNDPYLGTTKIVRFAEDQADWNSQFKINGSFEIKLEEVL